MATRKRYTSMFIVLFLILTHLSCTKTNIPASAQPQVKSTEIAIVNAAEENIPAEETHSDNKDENKALRTPQYGSNLGGGSRPIPRCGDGIIGLNEQCDDGNQNDDDHCSAQCTIKDGSPDCSWLCDDPECPAICDPVCEPPRCHTQCQPVINPPNCTCTAKCEKPECEIKCPDRGCEVLRCPECTTECKQPVCLVVCEPDEGNTTGCISPNPQCSATCNTPSCDWKCVKPACPKPKCELQCEEPRC